MLKNRYLLVENEKEKEERFIRFCKKVNDYVNTYNYENPPIMERIELETINVCNGLCSFCPANQKSDIRKPQMMSIELFKKIVTDLREINYNGIFSLHSNNEPFLDNRIIEFAKIARENLPDAFINILTNGSVMGLIKFKKIMPYLDEMVIDNYNDDLELNDYNKEIYEYIQKHPELDKKVIICLRKQNEVLRTRAGQAPNNHKKETWPCSCYLPYIQMVIRPDGKTSLCCNDVYGKVTIGDLNINTIHEVWTSSTANMYRKLLKDGRNNVDLCKYCDESYGLKNA